DAHRFVNGGFGAVRSHDDECCFTRGPAVTQHLGDDLGPDPARVANGYGEARVRRHVSGTLPVPARRRRGGSTRTSPCAASRGSGGSSLPPPAAGARARADRSTCTRPLRPP